MHFSITIAAVVAGMLALAQAHTAPTFFYVNGQSPGRGTCMRISHDGSTVVSPITDLTSTDMACGRNGNEGVARVCPVPAGAEITFEWDIKLDKPGLHIDDSHKGPCSFMMKKVESAINTTASGDGWFRIAYVDYDPTAKQWCTEKMFYDGRITVKLPEDLAGGNYLLRPELLALHTQTQPQFYVHCLQLFIDSAGTAVPTETVAIPSDAYAKQGTTAMNFGIWDKDGSTYPGYGPATYRSTGSVDAKAKSGLTQTEGVMPTGCILRTGNWCATEMPKYSTESACWESVKSCWSQANTCFSQSVLDNSICFKLQDKCRKFCANGNFNGPPDYMVDISETPPTLNPVKPPLQDLNKRTTSASSVQQANPNAAPAVAVAVAVAAPPSSTSSSSAPASSAAPPVERYGAPASSSSSSSSSGSSSSAVASVAAPQQTSTSAATSAPPAPTLAPPPPPPPQAPMMTSICSESITDWVTEVITVTVN
ncbi:MAG: hypothetical protein M1826_002226 [Phylliscum demangeonii]|nr:MAG: hypothetical protein M1826_002226 [Phylliscum demangeonii]